MLSIFRSLFALLVFIAFSNPVLACDKHNDQAEKKENVSALDSGKQPTDTKEMGAKDVKKLEKAEKQGKINKTGKTSSADKKGEDLEKRSENTINEKFPVLAEAKVLDAPISDAPAKLINNAAENSNSQAANAQPTKSAKDESAKVEKEEIAHSNSSTELDDLRVVEFVLADQIEGREPKGIVESFNNDSPRGFAFARLQANADKEVTFLWIRNGKEYARQTMPVKVSKKWRTYSSVKLRDGNWKVQLLSDDKVMAEKTFSIE